MYGKILIKAKLTVLTGMHIGGSNAFSAIGAVDSVVIRDALTKLPMIPGSSLKGKLRTLLARSVDSKIQLNDSNADAPEIKRLFGTSTKPIIRSRLQFADAFLLNAARLNELGGATEIKFENTINRLTSVATPRQVERVVRGAEFELALVYNTEEYEELQTDFDHIAKGLKLLQLDYLGGHGTRGYGKVKLSDFQVTMIEGDVNAVNLDNLSQILKDVEDYAVLSL